MKSEWKTGLKARTSAYNFLKKSLSSNYFTYQQIFEMLVPLIMDQFFVSIYRSADNRNDQFVQSGVGISSQSGVSNLRNDICYI